MIRTLIVGVSDLFLEQLIQTTTDKRPFRGYMTLSYFEQQGTKSDSLHSSLFLCVVEEFVPALAGRHKKMCELK